MELELLQWGSDMTIRLTYEDFIHGKDRVFLLAEAGLAFEVSQNDDDTETFTPVNLVETLRTMLFSHMRGEE